MIHHLILLVTQQTGGVCIEPPSEAPVGRPDPLSTSQPEEELYA
jgi:hypothetical protein